MKKNKKKIIFNNQMILTNGSSLKLKSIKFIKNYQLNFELFQKKINDKKVIINENQFSFLK